MDLVAGGRKVTRGEAVVVNILTRRSVAKRPYCVLRGVSCAWLGNPPQNELIKSTIMKTYLAAHIGETLRSFKLIINN